MYDNTFAEMLVDFIFSLFYTSIVYMLGAIITVLTQSKYTKKTLKRIVIINAIAGIIFFQAIHIYLETGNTVNLSATLIWSWYAYSILKKKSMIKEETENGKESPLRAKWHKGKEILEQGGWRCNKCGKYLSDIVGTCSCGNIKSEEQKDDADSLLSDEEREKKFLLDQGGWCCKKCGKYLSRFVGTCGCGNTRSNNDRM